MAEPTPAKPTIERLSFFCGPDLVGARWWQEAQTDVVMHRRRAALALLGVVVGLPLLAHVFGAASDAVGSSSGDAEAMANALELQRRDGWGVGRDNPQLDWSGAVDLDVSGTGAWRTHVQSLATDLAAPQPWQAWSIPTLLQMPGLPVNAGLSRQAQPVRTEPQMSQGWQVGRALAAQWAGLPTPPRDMLLVVDLPGPASVAVAAALADILAPVFVLDNCPHPAGVVPAHKTLGALLYFWSRWQEAAAVRPAAAGPVIVLDANRLLPYTDEPDRFDNRYLARLPSVAQLQVAGIRHVLYLSDHADVLDDVVDTTVAWQQAGVDVRVVDFTDFRTQTPLRGLVAYTPEQRAWYGGGQDADLSFWFGLGWYVPVWPRPVLVFESPASRWRPRPRPLRIASSIGRVKSYHWSSSSSGGSRSGSWTRTGGSSFG